jgi:uncharacterized protein YcfJ
MPTKLALAAACVVALAMPAAHAQVTFYSQEGFTGRTYAVGGVVPDFAASGFNDRASSLIVERGRWEACEHAGFRGQCVVLRRGQYPSLASMGMNDRISSVRPVLARPQQAYAPPPPPAPAYGYYPRFNENLYQANVVAVRVVIGPPEQRCWVERERAGRDAPNVPGAILGGVIGGVLGHQIGGGSGRDVATALGAIGGAAVGANTRGPSYNVQRCAAVPGSGQPAYWDVSYVFRGREYRAQLAFDPGPTITVNGRGEPRV